MTQEQSKVVEIDGKNYTFKLPNLTQSTEADMEYSRAYTKALQEGIWPKVSLERQLKKTGAWSDEEDQELQKLDQETQETIKQAVLEPDKEKRRELALKFYAMRERLAEMAGRKHVMLMNCAESKAEEAKLGSILWKCVFKEDGKLLWESKDALMNETDTNFVSQIGQTFISFLGRLEEKLDEINKLILGDSEETDSDTGDTTDTEVKPQAKKSPASKAK